MINLVNLSNDTSGPILESKGMHMIFQKKRQKGQNIWKFRQKYTKFENILKRGKWLHVIITHSNLLEKALCLGEDVVYNFIISMIEESKYCSDAIKKHFNKELVMTKKVDEDFEKSTNVGFVIMFYVDGDLKVRDHWHITGK